VARGQISNFGRKNGPQADRLRDIATEMEELFQREIELLKPEMRLTPSQVTEYKRIAKRIGELFSQLARLT